MHGKNKPEIEHKLQIDANETEVWSINNKLPIHYGNKAVLTYKALNNLTPEYIRFTDSDSYNI